MFFVSAIQIAYLLLHPPLGAINQSLLSRDNFIGNISFTTNNNKKRERSITTRNRNGKEKGKKIY